MSWKTNEQSCLQLGISTAECFESRDGNGGDGDCFAYGVEDFDGAALCIIRGNMALH